MRIIYDLTIYTIMYLLILITPAMTTWKSEYAQLPQSTRDWYKSQTMNPAAQKRLGVDWKSCCEHGDVVKTKFHVEVDDGKDAWYYIKDGEWKRVPPDIIHWGEHAPDGQPTLFVYQSTGQELCFYPPEEGI